MEKVFVTGATGFIGSELIKRLDDKGYAVEVLERYVTGRYGLGKNTDYVRHYASLTDYPAIRKIIREVAARLRHTPRIAERCCFLLQPLH